MAECIHRGTVIAYDDARGTPVCHGCGAELRDAARLLRALYAQDLDQWRLEKRVEVLVQLVMEKDRQYEDRVERGCV